MIYLPNSVIKETITETINGATYKLNFGRLWSWSVGRRESQYHSIRFTKNNTDIDPHVYDKEVFDKLVGKMYDKEVSSFINENFDKLKINYY